MGYGLAAFVAVALVLLFFGTYSNKETVSGWLVPRGGLIQVTARGGGVVTSISVKEGDHVRAGQVIAHVRLSTTLANGQDAGSVAIAALSSESSANKQQAQTARRKLLAEQSDLNLKLADLQAQVAETRRQMEFQDRQVEIARSNLARFKRLAAMHLISDMQVNERETALLSTEQVKSHLAGEEMSLRQQASDVTARLHAIPSDISQTGTNETMAAAQIDQKRVQTAIQSSDLVVASVEGKVLAIPVDEGQTLSPGATIAIVEPLNASLEAELYVPSRAVGFVRPGDDVHLMYQAFPFEKFGIANAKVMELSRTILAPSEVSMPASGIQQPVFRVRAALDRQTIQAYGQAVPLQPGMLLTGEIVFDRRSLVEWLFDPIYAATK